MRSAILLAVDRIAPFIMIDKTDIQDIQHSWSPNESPEIMDKIARLAITLKQQTDEVESVDRALCGVVHALSTLLSDETGSITDFKRMLTQIKNEVLKSHSRISRRTA